MVGCGIVGGMVGGSVGAAVGLLTRSWTGDGVPKASWMRSSTLPPPSTRNGSGDGVGVPKAAWRKLSSLLSSHPPCEGSRERPVANEWVEISY